MQSISRTLLALRQTCLLGRRTYFTTGARWKNIDNLVRRFLINSNGPKKKRRWYETNMLQNPTHLAQPQLKGEKNSHRLHVLNKVFLEKICDLLSTGRLSALFVGYGLEISRVQVAAGMTSVNVHWYCTGSDVDDNISKLLESSANHIRFELSKQNMIGRVPPILFVKDRRYYKIMEVERCLALADFGEDFVPSDPTHHVKTNLVLREELGDEITKALKITEENNEDFFKEALKLSASLSHKEEKIDLPSDLPVMRDEVLGVNTQKIFTLVKQSMTRARAEHRKVSNDSSFSQSASFPSVSGAPRTEEIRQWVNKYKNLRKKQKQTKNLDDAYLSLPQYIDDDDDYNEEILPEEEKDYMEENFYLDMHEKT
ncbi:uncharacterized protein LOC135214354 [Macrobrachium nipponense]|uniref:uncharacterized protein LOC135214354 n=1 Tax=Macrobrachium nipponense TaxID=159736 RepID=UPI0030C8AAB9